MLTRRGKRSTRKKHQIDRYGWFPFVDGLSLERVAGGVERARVRKAQKTVDKVARVARVLHPKEPQPYFADPDAAVEAVPHVAV